MQARRHRQENCLLLPPGLGIVCIREATLEYIAKRYYSIREAMPKPIDRDQRNIFFGFGIVSCLFLFFFFLSHFAFTLTIYLYISSPWLPYQLRLSAQLYLLLHTVSVCFAIKTNSKPSTLTTTCLRDDHFLCRFVRLIN